MAGYTSVFYTDSFGCELVLCGLAHPIKLTLCPVRKSQIKKPTNDNETFHKISKRCRRFPMGHETSSWTSLRNQSKAPPPLRLWVGEVKVRNINFLFFTTAVAARRDFVFFINSLWIRKQVGAKEPARQARPASWQRSWKRRRLKWFYDLMSHSPDRLVHEVRRMWVPDGRESAFGPNLDDNKMVIMMMRPAYGGARIAVLSAIKSCLFTQSFSSKKHRREAKSLRLF